MYEYFCFATLGARFVFFSQRDCTHPTMWWWPIISRVPPKSRTSALYGTRGNEVATRRFQESRTGVRLIPLVTSSGTEGWGVEKPDRRCREAAGRECMGGKGRANIDDGGGEIEEGTKKTRESWFDSARRGMREEPCLVRCTLWRDFPVNLRKYETARDRCFQG